jgi:hypothetical protein
MTTGEIAFMNLPEGSSVGKLRLTISAASERAAVPRREKVPGVDLELLGRLPSDAFRKVPRLLAERLHRKTLLNVRAICLHSIRCGWPHNPEWGPSERSAESAWHC